MESLHSVTRCDHTPTPVHGDRERGMSVDYYYLVIECKDSKKTEEVLFSRFLYYCELLRIIIKNIILEYDPYFGDSL